MLSVPLIGRNEHGGPCAPRSSLSNIGAAGLEEPFELCATGCAAGAENLGGRRVVLTGSEPDERRARAASAFSTGQVRLALPPPLQACRRYLRARFAAAVGVMKFSIPSVPDARLAGAVWRASSRTRAMARIGHG